MVGEDGRARCYWAGSAPEYIAYHDEEWGRAVRDDQGLYERMTLEAFQSGLAWITILRKREGFRKAFAGFDIDAVAAFGEDDFARLMADAGIVRNRLKIESTISNARAYLDFQSEHGGFAKHLWTFVGGKPIQNRWTQHKQVPATSPESDALSKDLKQRGFRFVGTTIIYAHMQATGMVNDHVTGCFRYKECKALGKKGN